MEILKTAQICGFGESGHFFLAASKRGLSFCGVLKILWNLWCFLSHLYYENPERVSGPKLPAIQQFSSG